jgi:hypothetical protein
MSDNQFYIDKLQARIEALEAALLPAKNALNAVRILMKNQDRREHEQQVYEAVQVCCEIVEAALLQGGVTGDNAIE